MKKLLVVLTAAVLVISTSLPAAAGQGAMQRTFQNAFYGGLVGALVGGALLIFQDKPEEKLEYISYGFGAGVLVGAAYGVVKSTKALAEIEGGKLNLAVPSIKTGSKSVAGKKYVELSADLLSVRF